MPGIPYAQLALVGFVALVVGALLFAAYRWGRNAERARVAEAVTKTEREVHDAVDEARSTPVRIDEAWLKGSRAGAPPKRKS